MPTHRSQQRDHRDFTLPYGRSRSAPRRPMQPLSEGKGEQARAEQRDAGRSQCQEATGNKVVICA